MRSPKVYVSMDVDEEDPARFSLVVAVRVFITVKEEFVDIQIFML